MKKLHIGIIVLYIAGALWGVAGCDVAPTVGAEDVYQISPGGDSGTQNLQVSAVYPNDNTGIVPIDTDVVIVFSKAVDETTLAGNVTVAGAPAFAIVVSNDKKVVRLQFVSDLLTGQTYTVSVAVGVTDVNGNALVPDIANPTDTTPYTEDFVTVPDTFDLYDPRLLGIYPVNAAPDISAELEYVEVYFSEDINASTVTSATFTISGGAASGVPVQMDARTFRLYLNTLAYATTYTVTLTAGITDLTGDALDSAPLTRTFITEGDETPAPGGTSGITSNWVSDVLTDEAAINWITNIQTEAVDTTIEYGTGTGYGTSIFEGAAGSWQTVHAVTLTSLSAATKYYYRVTWNDGTYTDTVTGSFITAEDGGSSDDDSIDSNTTDKSSLTLVQDKGVPGTTGKGYAFWSSSSGNCYGQFFESDGSAQWAADGEQVNASSATLKAFSDGRGGALLTIDDGNGFYVKHLYNLVVAGTPALTFNPGNSTLSVAGWDDDNDATGNGLTFSHVAGYTSPGAAMVYSGIDNDITAEFVTKVVPGPAVSTANVVEMTGYTVPTTLIFDRDLDFTTVSGFTTGDYILTGFNYGGPDVITDDIVDISFYADGFDYTVNESVNRVGTGVAYAILDATSPIAGNADGFTVDPAYPDSDVTDIYTTDNMAALQGGDIIYNNTGDADDGYYAYVVSSVYDANGYYHIVISTDIGIDNGEDFVALMRLEGQIGGTGTARATEGLGFELWDNDADFSSVAVGDVVLNEFDAVSTDVTTVSTRYPANPRVLRLANNIMGNDQNYWIVNMPTGTGDIIAFGARLTGDAVNVLSSDGNENNPGALTFLDATVGDVVYNINDNTFAAVIQDNGASLTLSRDIVSNTADTDAYLVLESDEPLLDLGVCTANGANQLVDANADFVNGGVRAGDILYHDNGAGGYNVFVIRNVAAMTLTITGNTTIGRHYYIIQPRALVAWHDSASPSNIWAAMVNLHDGSLAWDAALIVDHANNVRNPHVIADGTGGAFVIYEDSTGSTIRGKRLDAAGNYLVGTNAANIGENLGAGSIIDVISDGATGIYLLYDNGTNVALRRWRSTLLTGSVTWAAPVTLTTTDNDAALILSSSGAPVVAFADSNNDLHIQGLSAAGGITFSAAIFTLQSYVQNESSDITKNNISLASTENGGAFVSWIDYRYYSTLGYVVMGQAYDAAGGPQWDIDAGAATDYTGMIIGVTGSYNSELVADEALVQSLFSGAASPADGHFFWYDVRNSTTDIFYDILAY